MAPEIALKRLESLPHDYVVLDPMSGSGMVLGTAAKLGLTAIGYDLDPLARMITRANGNFISETRVRAACEKLLSLCQKSAPTDFCLPWLDNDSETSRYVNFWFAKKQQEQLRLLSYYLVAQPFTSNRSTLDILKTVVSRLIITKEPKASLARDTAHSRPHKTITNNDFDVLAAIPKSLDHVLSALRPAEIKSNVKIYKGDARRMGRIQSNYVDSIVTSPPYLNAIDYLRGHKLSLVWLGYSISDLKKLRARSVGAEVSDKRKPDATFQEFVADLNLDVDEKKREILKKYYSDLCKLTDEAFRVLKKGRTATYVIGNSSIKGHEIRNSELLVAAAKLSGFRVSQSDVRDIPENRRYMPLANSGQSSLSKRMRTEHIIEFEKAV